MIHALCVRLVPYAAGAAIVFPITMLILVLAELSGEFAPETKQVDVEEVRMLAMLGLFGTFFLGAAYAFAAFVAHQPADSGSKGT